MDFSKHSQGTTSVKVHHAPGGKSNFSLGWDVPTTTTNPKANTKPAPIPTTTNNITKPLAPSNNNLQPTDAKTSVKVHNPPGGRSNIIFG
jgi:hypothetical protein